MTPHVTLHMMASIDGCTVTEWPSSIDLDVFERIHSELAGDAWIVGTATMAEIAEGGRRSVTATERFPRETWKAPHAHQGPYGVALDRRGRLHLNRRDIDGDPLVMILTTGVSDDHLAELRRDGISYLFAGDNGDIDLNRALEILRSDFGIERLLLEGGGNLNGSFLAADLIDEISLLVMPVADGSGGISLFERIGGTGVNALRLLSMNQLDQDVVHLRYRVDRFYF